MVGWLHCFGPKVREHKAEQREQKYSLHGGQEAQRWRERGKVQGRDILYKAMPQ
jgi:hypothetical protein